MMIFNILNDLFILWLISYVMITFIFVYFVFSSIITVNLDGTEARDPERRLGQNMHSLVVRPRSRTANTPRHQQSAWNLMPRNKNCDAINGFLNMERAWGCMITYLVHFHIRDQRHYLPDFHLDDPIYHGLPSCYTEHTCFVGIGCQPSSPRPTVAWIKCILYKPIFYDDLSLERFKCADVRPDLGVDGFLLGSDFPEGMRHSFEKKHLSLRHAGQWRMSPQEIKALNVILI